MVISYLDLTWAYSVREEYLRLNYGFACDCRRCAADRKRRRDNNDRQVAT